MTAATDANIYTSKTVDEEKTSYLRLRKAAKGGKKYAGWKHVNTVQAIASILHNVLVSCLCGKDLDQ